MGDVNKARMILDSAFKANPDCEDFYLAAFKLEAEVTCQCAACLVSVRARVRTSRASGESHVYIQIAG